jgi:antitoxin component YwqK of YwqJK toxin-antitoxin module
MKLQDILKIKETSECIVHHELTEDWKNCYYQLKGDESNNNGEVVSKFEEKYNESGWGELGNDHESVFDPTKEVFEDSSLTTIHKREYKSSVFILMIQIRIKEYLSLDESKGFEDFEDWIEVGGHYAVQDLCEKIDCFEYELTVDKPDDKYLWFSHYELSSDYSKIWIEEIKTDNESINDVNQGEKFVNYYENGQIKDEGYYIKDLNNRKNLRLKENIIWKDFEFYTVGVETLEIDLKEQENYEFGLRDGVYKSYHENGRIKEIGNYENGEKEGIYKKYYKNEQLREESYFEKGVKKKYSNKFYESGNYKEKILYPDFNNILSTGYIKECGDYKGYSGNRENIIFFTKLYNKPPTDYRFTGINKKVQQLVSDERNNITPQDRLELDLKKLEREKNSRNQGGCLVVILFLLSLTLSLII